MEDEEEEEEEMTTWERFVVLGLMTSGSLSFSLTASLMLPFLPLELNALDLPGQLLTGIIFAIYPLMTLLFSPLCNLLAKKVGRVPLLYAGVPLQLVSTVVFGLAEQICGLGASIWGTSRWPTVVLFVVTRATQGFGAALANLAIFAIVAESFHASLGKVMGFNEVVIGVSFMAGPVVGSVLYTAGGFALPFLAAAGIVSISFPFIIAYHRLAQPHGAAKAKADEKEEDHGVLKQIWLILTWRVALTTLILFLGTGAFGWVETILSLHLKYDLKYEDKYIGVIFAVINVTYSGFGLIVGALSDRIGYKSIMVAGMALTGLSYVLMGPLSPVFAHVWVALFPKYTFLNVERVWEVLLLGLFGAFQSMLLIPTLPAMKESIGENLNQQAVNNVVCLFNQAQQSGLMFSPPLAGLLGPLIGYNATMGVYGLICVCVGLSAAFMFCSFGPRPPPSAMSRTQSLEDPLLVPSPSLDPRGDDQPLLSPQPPLSIPSGASPRVYTRSGSSGSNPNVSYSVSYSSSLRSALSPIEQVSLAETKQRKHRSSVLP